MTAQKTVQVTANKTLTAADAGIVQVVRGDFVVTLPATANGLTFIVENGGAVVTNGPTGTSQGNKSAGPQVSPAAADGITGNGFTATVNKDAINTKATASVGDRIELVGTGTTGVTGYIVASVSGTWAREA